MEIDKEDYLPKNRTYMKSWFAYGDTPEGLEKLAKYIYTTAPHDISPSGLMCSISAAVDLIRKQEREIKKLKSELNAARQQELFEIPK